MNPTVVQNLINDSAQLVEASVELEKQAGLANQKVAELVKQNEAANQKVAELTKAANDFKVAIRTEAEKTADALIARGFQIKRAEFIDRLVDHPLEMFGVIDKVAKEASAPQMGIGAGDESVDGGIDPIARYAMGG